MSDYYDDEPQLIPLVPGDDGPPNDDELHQLIYKVNPVHTGPFQPDAKGSDGPPKGSPAPLGSSGSAGSWPATAPPPATAPAPAQASAAGDVITGVAIFLAVLFVVSRL